jgi:hypothetical protein
VYTPRTTRSLDAIVVRVGWHAQTNGMGVAEEDSGVGIQDSENLSRSSQCVQSTRDALLREFPTRLAVCVIDASCCPCRGEWGVF